MTTAAQTTAPVQADPVQPMLQVISTPPAEVSKDSQLISWSRRSTEKNPVPAAQRFRGVIQPVSVLTLPDGSTTSKFSRLLQNTINDLADARFTAWVKDNMHAAEMPASFTSMDSILAFYSEEKQRQTIDGDKLAAWLKTSKTVAALPAATQKSWLEKLPKMAAPGFANIFTRDQAATIISRFDESECDAPEAAFIITRCNTIINKVSEVDAF